MQGASVPGAAFDRLDTEFYWQKINREEEQGARFVDILKDYLAFEKESFYKGSWVLFWWVNFRKIEEKKGMWGVALAVLLLCVGWGVTQHFLLHEMTFLQAFAEPFLVFGAVSLLLLPCFLLRRKHQKAADSLYGTIAAILGVVMGFVILFAVVVLLIAAFRGELGSLLFPGLFPGNGKGRHPPTRMPQRVKKDFLTR